MALSANRGLHISLPANGILNFFYYVSDLKKPSIPPRASEAAAAESLSESSKHSWSCSDSRSSVVSLKGLQDVFWRFMSEDCE